MAETALKLTLIGTDKSASKAMHGLERSTKGATGSFSKLSSVGKGALLGLAGGLLVAGKAAIDFGGASLDAFRDADRSQAKLEDAYKRFPKVQSISIESMRKYNQVLQRKTGADADDIAAAQAQLAAYKLTGKQVRDMTPLLVDYAAKTGKSLPDAAKVMGKAVMGSGKALKELGLNFKDTKDPGKNLEQVMAGLREKVGGFADSIPEADKKQKILAASAGDLQEAFGEKLQPAMLGLTDTGQAMLDWLDANPAVMEGVTAAGSLLGDMLLGIWTVIRKYVLPGFGLFVEGAGNIVHGIAGMVDAMNDVPGLGDIIPDDAADKLNTTADGIMAVAGGLKAMANDPPVKLKVDPTPLEKLDKKIRGIKDRIVVAKAKGDDKEVDRLTGKLNKLKGKRIGVEAHVYKTGIKGVAIRGVGGGKMTINAYASGSSSVPFDQFAVVGDAGPEVVRLPAGSQVMSNGQARAAGNQGRLGSSGAPGAGGGMNVQMMLSGLPAGPRAFAEAIERELYGLLKSRGPGGTLSFQRKGR